jgi:hypothetical protein
MGHKQTWRFKFLMSASIPEKQTSTRPLFEWQEDRERETSLLLGTFSLLRRQTFPVL